MTIISYEAALRARKATEASNRQLAAIEPLAHTVARFATLSDLSPGTVNLAIRRGDLRAIRIGGRRLILHDDGIAWLRRARPTT